MYAVTVSAPSQANRERGRKAHVGLHLMSRELQKLRGLSHACGIIRPMSKSLQEQLLAAGLASKKQAKSINQSKRKKRKKRGKKPPPTDAVKEKILREAAEKARRDRELNRQREARIAARSARSQVAQIIDDHAVSRDGADVVHRFVLEGKVKQIYVTSQQRDQLAAGLLRIVLDRDHFHLVDKRGADLVALRDPSALVPLADAGDDDVDDDYKDFEVPDDLMW